MVLWTLPIFAASPAQLYGPVKLAKALKRVLNLVQPFLPHYMRVQLLMLYT